MKQHFLMSVAIILFLIGCTVGGPSKEDLEEDKRSFEFVRGCGDASGVSRNIVEYDCKYLDCRLSSCYIKICGDVFQPTDLELSETECKAEFRAGQ